MAPRTGLAAVSIVTGLVIGPAPEVLAQTTVEANTWDEAISKLDCGEINRNADGSFSVTAVIKINGEDHHYPIINVPKYTAEIETKKCADPINLARRFVGWSRASRQAERIGTKIEETRVRPR